jgi:hypothetical protein
LLVPAGELGALGAVELRRTAAAALLRLGLAVPLGVDVVLVVLPLGDLESVREALHEAVPDRL